MNILLINPRNGNPNTKPPLGLLSIGTICKQAGHSVVILDAALLDLDAKQVAIHAGYADMVGLTAMTPLVGNALSIAAAIKKLNADIPIIIGGVHASLFPDELYKTGLFSSVVVGEGEDTIFDILASIQSPEAKLKPIYKPTKFAEIPMLDYSLIDIEAYQPRYPHAQRTPWVSTQTSRGCPFNCSFCCNIFGHKHRSMPPAQIIQMINGLVNGYGVKDITFYDDEFTLDRNHVIQLCELINDSKLATDLTWTCEARVDMVDSELLASMRKAGCRLIYFGIESGNQHILDKLNKHQTLEAVSQAVELTHRSGIQSAGYFMLGCPDETKDSMKQTVAFSLELKLDHAQFSVCCPLPGSELYKQYGDGKDWDSYQYLANVPKVACAAELNIGEIEKAVEEANNLFNQKVALGGKG